MIKHSFAWRVVPFAALLALACGDDDGMPRVDGGGMSDGGSPDGGPGSPLDCPGFFDCIGECPDDPCLDGCIARVTPAAEPIILDLLTCVDDNGCEDEACIEAFCTPELAACAGVTPMDGGVPDGGMPDSGRPLCTPLAGVPELTGPLSGLRASYVAGDPMQVAVPVDEDTARVIVGIYEVGSSLYLGGNAEDVAPSSTTTLDLFAGVRGGETGTFFISVELCSTSVCTTPFVRNTYDRVDRFDPSLAGETYFATRENVGGPAMQMSCTTDIPMQAFDIE